MNNSIENIKEKISEKAEKEIKLLEEEFNKKLEQVLQDLNNKFEISKNKINEEYILKKKLEKERLISKIELDSKRILLSKKQEILQEILERIEEKIINISNDDFLTYVKKNIGDKKDYTLVLPNKFKELDIEYPSIEYDDIEIGFLLKKDGVILNYILKDKLNFNMERVQKYIFDNIG